jgi:hypothetical protein
MYAHYIYQIFIQKSGQVFVRGRPIDRGERLGFNIYAAARIGPGDPRSATVIILYRNRIGPPPRQLRLLPGPTTLCAYHTFVCMRLYIYI